MPPQKPIEIRPKDGGRLMTAVGSDVAGIANWTVKTDWRRDLDEEIRSEGYDLFTPNYLQALQPPTGGQPITLVAQCTRINGQIAVVAGTQTGLWRYCGVADQDWEYDVFGYVDQGYSQPPPGTWAQIGSGFSTSGRRWEAVSIDGYLVLNNGVDLPVTYQVQDLAVVPIYELREQGIASVGTIAEHDGILICSDLKAIKGTAQIISGQAAYFGGDSIFNFNTSLSTPHGLNSGTPVTISSAADSLFNGTFIVTVTSPVSFSCVCQPQTNSAIDKGITATYDPLTNLMNAPQPYGLVDSSIVDELKARVTWSAPNQPRRFAASFPCTVNATSNALTLQYPVSSIVPGMSILIVGAGLNGGNLTATVIYVSGLTVTVGDQAITLAQKDVSDAFVAAQNAVTAAQQLKTNTAASVVTAQASLAAAITGGDAATIATAQSNLAAAVQNDNAAGIALTNAQNALTAAKNALSFETDFVASDMFGGIAGQFEDLEGDGAGVLKALTLRTNLILYTETRIFVGTYTGNTTGPFDFQKIDIPDGTALHHRDTLVLLTGAGHFTEGIAYGGAAHIYAGRNAFYRFDITNQVPMEMPEFQPCQDLFFKGAIGSEVFAVDNPVLKEILFCFPNISAPDKALRWDYRFGTVSTTAVAITAASGITRPEAQLVTGQTEQWFVMGTPTGQLLRYGFIAANAVDSQVASVSGGTITISKSATSQIVTCSDPFFTDHMIGWSLISDTSEIILAIIGFTDNKTVTVLGSGTIKGETFKIVGAIWHRNQAPYDSTLQSGMESFGNQGSLKVVDRYSVMPGSNSPDSPITATLRSAINPKRVSDKINLAIARPNDTNMFPVLLADYFIGDRLMVSGINNPFRLSSRIFDITQRSAKGFDRH